MCITLFQQQETFSKYKIDLMNPLITNNGVVPVERLRKPGDASLGVVSESSTLLVTNPERVAEIVFEVVPIEYKSIHRFTAKINEYMIVFRIKISSA